MLEHVVWGFALIEFWSKLISIKKRTPSLPFANSRFDFVHIYMRSEGVSFWSGTTGRCSSRTALVLAVGTGV